MKKQQMLTYKYHDVDHTIFSHDKVYIFPTDTVYGIGMLWTPTNNAQAHINTIKGSDPAKKLSCIAPSFGWIYHRYPFLQMGILEDYFAKYRQITFICDEDSPGWRVIRHPIQRVVYTLGIPLISTSANITGQPPLTSVDKIPFSLSTHIDVCLDDGIRDGTPSTIINLVTGEVTRR